MIGKKGIQQLEGAKPHSLGRGRSIVLEEPMSFSFPTGGDVVENTRGVEIVYELESWVFTILDTIFFLEAQIWLEPPISLARQFNGVVEVLVPLPEGSSTSKEPSLLVVLVANLFTLAHFTKTLMPETQSGCKKFLSFWMRWYVIKRSL